MRDVLDDSILVLEAVIHLLIHIRVVLPELSKRVSLNLLDALLLPSELRVELVRKFCLPLQPSFLLCVDGVFDLVCLLL